jgi:DNA (cytosine-5)-methyltransferase 1
MAAQLRPAVVIMENVPEMNVQQVNMKGRLSTVPELVREGLESSGYDVSEPFVLDACDIGVPQKRRRSFMIAVRSPGTDPDEVARITARAAVRKQKVPLGTSIDGLARYPAVAPAAWKSAAFPDHVARVPNTDDMRIIRNLIQGENYASLVARKPSVLDGRTHRIYGTASFRDKFYRLSPDIPSMTVVAHLQKDGNSFIHPFLDRSISVREAARIQSFPDSFIFGVPMSHAYRLVGNAVPPLVGKFLAETVARITGIIDDREAAGMEFASMVA